MDLLYEKIIQETEAYITDDNLKNDCALANCVRENDGWIRLELLGRCNKLSSYSYETILHALRTKPSNIIELSVFEPRCIRRCCQPLISDSIQDNQTVVITGLPYDVRYEELIEFFNQFYPIKEIIMFSLSNRFNGKIHVIFNKSQDALEFVQQSKLRPIIYINDHLFQSCNGYTLICKMLNDHTKKNLIQSNNQYNFIKGKSFSTRLNNHSSHTSFNTNTSFDNNKPVHQKTVSNPFQTKSCLKSNTCATEQIIFCQNITNNKNKSIKNIEYDKQKIVYNKFSYEFYRPDHLLKQINECVIISVLNPHCFTIQFKQDALEFNKFQRDINKFYNTIDDQQYYIKPEQIRINLCVVCSDSKSENNEKIWNRSQILDFDPTDNTVNLFYVDLGTWDEYVPINRLRHINDRFHSHIVFSIPCRLAHIQPLNNDNDQLTWTDDATNQFLAVIDQAVSKIELLPFTLNGCYQTNLFVINSGQDVYVNDYMIHIQKAKSNSNITNTDDDDGQSSIQSDEHDTNSSDGSPIHPVIALYNRLGEILQQSLSASRTTSISSSSMSSPSTLPRLYVKLIHVNIEPNTSNKRDYNNQQQMIPIIFIYYQKTIFIPDFNICNLLKMINSNTDIHTIEHYAFAIRYNGVNITQESNFDIFTQLSSLIDIQYLNNIRLHTLDFVGYILEHYNFPVVNVFLALENAKRAQSQTPDLALWFAMDNELNTSFIPVSNGITKFPHPSLAQQSSTPIRLPFSNRLINLM